MQGQSALNAILFRPASQIFQAGMLFYLQKLYKFRTQTYYAAQKGKK
jgi:hypothetical protein